MHRGRRQRLRGIGLAAASLLVGAALVAQTGVTTDATWNDTEWAHNTVGTVDCTNPADAFATRGEGRVLSGSLLGTDTDVLAEVSGVEVTNDGTRSQETRGTATELGDDAYANPLNVVALSTLDINLGQGMLQLPLDNSTGVLGQYGQAKSTGNSTGAAGFITNTGGIATAPGNEYPVLGSINLKQLLNSVGLELGNLVSGVTDLSLEMGAVAGRTSIDGCLNAWGQDIADSLVREYLVASLDTKIESNTVGALVGGVEGVIDNLEQTVNGLSSNQGVLSSILGGVSTLLNGLISNPILSLGNISVVLSASIDTSHLRPLLTETISDAEGTLSIDLDSGAITVDTAALLAAAYPGDFSDGLNGLLPNTDLLADEAVLDALTVAVTGVLDDWLARVTLALEDTIDAVLVEAAVTIALAVKVCVPLTDICSDVPIGTISAHIAGALKDLLDGNIAATTTTDLDLGLIGALLEAIVDPIIDALLLGLVNDLGEIVGNAVEGVLGGLRALPGDVNDLALPIVSVVSGVYSELFLSGVLQLLVNAQNDPSEGGNEPLDWTPSSGSGIPDGRYDVAALRIGVLNIAEDNAVWLYLGRGSVGVNCSVAHAAVPGSPCANY